MAAKAWNILQLTICEHRAIGWALIKFQFNTFMSLIIWKFYILNYLLETQRNCCLKGQNEWASKFKLLCKSKTPTNFLSFTWLKMILRATQLKVFCPNSMLSTKQCHCGCHIAVEHTLPDREAVCLNPVGCWAFFFSSQFNQ